MRSPVSRHLDCWAGETSIGHAICHLEGLRRHLVETGHRGEASAVVTVIDMLRDTHLRLEAAS